MVFIILMMEKNNVYSKILEYLFYKIYALTKLMDDRGNSITHVSTMMSLILFLYYIDIIIVYRFVIKQGMVYWNFLKVLGISYLVYIALWIMIYSYFKYKHRYLQIMKNKTFENSSNLWAYIFTFTPLVLFIVISFL